MGVTDDLMKKIGDDVSLAMCRTLALADERLPVATAGGAAAIGNIAAILSEINNKGPSDPDPDPECIMLAALICARIGMGHSDPISQAYADAKTLKYADR